MNDGLSPASPLLSLEEANRRALAARFDPGAPLSAKAAAAPHRGFVEVRVPGAPPFLMFNNDDDVVAQHYLYRQRPGFEEASLRVWVALAKRARRAFDVGAFTGIYALAACAANPSLVAWAFEPSRNTYGRLLTNVWGNRFDARLAPLNFALGGAAAAATIRHPFGVYVLGSGESLLSEMIARPTYEESVEVFPADELETERQKQPGRFVIPLPIEAVELVKLDVEGYEPAVLDGMQRLIGKYRPALLIECLSGALLDEVSSRLSGYRRWFVDDLAGELHNDRARWAGGSGLLPADEKPSESSRNVLFLPPGGIDLSVLCAEAGLVGAPAAR